MQIYAPKMQMHTMQILQQILKDFESMSDQRVEGLKYVSKG